MQKDIKLSAGDVVRALREKQKISIRNLAIDAKLTTTTVYHIEQNQLKDTGPELEKLAKALGVEVEYLFCGNGNLDLSPNDIALLREYHALPQEGRDCLRALIRWQYVQTLQG